MDLESLIKHPEQMNKETLFELRSLLALHPYYQTARLLMLQNLYLLHDSSFDEELRKAAIYITDRKKIFNLVEAAHYRIKPQAKKETPTDKQNNGTNRTLTLIDQFLDSLPSDDDKKGKTKRKPTPADAAVDYVAYLLETEEETPTDAPQAMKGQHLIDNFIDKEQGKNPTQGDTRVPAARREHCRKHGKRCRRGLLYRDIGPNLHQTRKIFEGFGNN